MSPHQLQSVRRNLSRDKCSFTGGLLSGHASMVVSSDHKVSSLKFGRTLYVIRNATFAALQWLEKSRYIRKSRDSVIVRVSKQEARCEISNFNLQLHKRDDFRHLLLDQDREFKI